MEMEQSTLDLSRLMWWYASEIIHGTLSYVADFLSMLTIEFYVLNSHASGSRPFSDMISALVELVIFFNMPSIKVTGSSLTRCIARIFILNQILLRLPMISLCTLSYIADFLSILTIEFFVLYSHASGSRPFFEHDFSTCRLGYIL